MQTISGNRGLRFADGAVAVLFTACLNPVALFVRRFISNKNISTVSVTALVLLAVAGSAVAQAPGDRSPLEATHPAFESFDLLGTREIRAGGMDVLPDGRLVISNWRPMDVYYVDGIYGDDANAVTYTKFADNNFGISDLLGLKVVDGKVYVLDRERILRLDDKDGNGTADVVTTIATGWGYDKNVVQPLAYGMIWKDNGFWFTLGQGLSPSGSSSQTQVKDRGATIKAKLDGTYEVIAMGHRQANGIGFGPDSSVMVVDNQGSWYPSCALVHVKPGRFFGHPNSTTPEWNAKPVTPPVAWFPQDEIGNSSSHPFYMDRGYFAGQMLVGDIRYGGIIRVAIEKVKGEWQGAAFRFGNGLKAGVNRIMYGKDGSLLIGEIGESPGNHAWMNDREFGLHRWREKKNPAPWFEMMAVRSRALGMEIEYTLPVDAAGEVAGNYEVKQWGYKPEWGYGGNKQNNTTMSVSKVQLSPDRKQVFLEIPGLKTGQVVYIRLKGVKSQTGLSPWTTEAFYTLNAIGDGELFSKPTAIKNHPAFDAQFSQTFKVQRIGEALQVKATWDKAYHLELRNMQGVLLRKEAVMPGVSGSLSLAGIKPGIYLTIAAYKGQNIKKRIAIY
ncbi:MAG: hypothetical protein M3Y08_16440 [Fibrobacterota bacterium]|nr:hypothetical protein [Fibrobacterota bacterium]